MTSRHRWCVPAGCAFAVLTAAGVACAQLTEPPTTTPPAPTATAPAKHEDPGIAADRLLAKAASPAEAALAWLDERAAATPGGESPEARFARAIEEATAKSKDAGAGVRVFDGATAKWIEPAVDANAKLPARAVLMVGGFDERGTIFDTAAPALAAALAESRSPVLIARFDAGSDRALRPGADMLAAALRDLAKRGVERVDLVGHSSGGLLIRDVITRAEQYNGFPAPAEGSKGQGLPRIGRVVLIATPNRGSWLAPVRAARGARDYFAGWIESSGVDPSQLMTFLNDGSGETTRDLVPGSAYLTELNARPAPKWVKGTTAAPARDEIPITVVVGTLAGGSALEGVDLKATLAWPIVQQAFKDSTDSEKAIAAIDELGRLVSDGLVPVTSAELEGADDVVYAEANHRSLLRPWVQGETEQPPAVKVIVERLK